MAQGLKEALGKGVDHAISSLGREGGFLTNLNVRIPMPEKLQSAEKTLRMLGQDQMADEFIGAMNHAAERAVPEATSVLREAITRMTIEDARAILTGPDDAATQYFRSATETNLFERFHPVVKRATDEVGVTARYKQMMNRIGGSGSLGGLFGAGSVLSPEAADIDSYVTDKALDGLFHMVAQEERRIRENPVARTTELLQKVFGAYGK